MAVKYTTMNIVIDWWFKMPSQPHNLFIDYNFTAMMILQLKAEEIPVAVQWEWAYNQNMYFWKSNYLQCSPVPCCAVSLLIESLYSNDGCEMYNGTVA